MECRLFILGSLEVRSLRPSELKYRVGQVITHKTWGYRGVIIGWDLEAKVRLLLNNNVLFIVHLIVLMSL